MNKNVLKLYRKFRSVGIGGIYGQNAMDCLRNARIVDEFENGEYSNNLRIIAEEESDNYFDVMGRNCISEKEDKRQEEIIERLGNWCVSAQYRLSDDSDWIHADSIGMCTGYENPASPFENGYVPDLMKSAIDALKKEMDDTRGIKTLNPVGPSAQIVKLNSGNDRNGNPKRVFVRLIGGRADQAFDEGYRGTGAIPKAIQNEYKGLIFDITRSDYNHYVKNYTIKK